MNHDQTWQRGAHRPSVFPLSSILETLDYENATVRFVRARLLGTSSSWMRTVSSF